jgi:hypothetical protein
MAFDAFQQFIEPGSNAPKVVGEDQAPPVQSPTAARLDDEALPEAQEKVSDTTLPSKP